jgi:hypothetical protein
MSRKSSAQLSLTGHWPVQSLPPGVNRVGRMEIGPEILGYGSSGTLVFEGTLDGRPIAVKRILCQVHRAVPTQAFGAAAWRVNVTQKEG